MRGYQKQPTAHCCASISIGEKKRSVFGNDGVHRAGALSVFVPGLSELKRYGRISGTGMGLYPLRVSRNSPPLAPFFLFAGHHDGYRVIDHIVQDCYCCCSHINSHNHVRGHRTGSSLSGAEEYPREKHKQTHTRYITADAIHASTRNI